MTKLYRERPNLRRWILKYLKDKPHLTLEDLSNRYWIEASGSRRTLFITEGWRTQARKMLQEKDLCAKDNEQVTSGQKPKKLSDSLNFEQMLIENNKGFEERRKAAEERERRNIFEPYRVAVDFLASVYPSRDYEIKEESFVEVGLKYLDSSFSSPDGDIPDQILKGQIAEYFHEQGWKITMANVDLVLLCLQTVWNPRPQTQQQLAEQKGVVTL